MDSANDAGGTGRSLLPERLEIGGDVTPNLPTWLAVVYETEGNEEIIALAPNREVARCPS